MPVMVVPAAAYQPGAPASRRRLTPSGAGADSESGSNSEFGDSQQAVEVGSRAVPVNAQDASASSAQPPNAPSHAPFEVSQAAGPEGDMPVHELPNIDSDSDSARAGDRDVELPVGGGGQGMPVSRRLETVTVAVTRTLVIPVSSSSRCGVNTRAWPGDRS